MCKLCCLIGDDVLVHVWNHLPLRAKLCRVTRLSRCNRVRQSLLLPTTYKHDEVHIRCASIGAADILERLSLVRLPAYLSCIPSLAITFTHLMREPKSFPQDRSQFIGEISVSSASTQAINEDNSTITERSTKRHRVTEPMVGLASLVQLRTLLLLELRCPNCSHMPVSASESVLRTGSNVAREFPWLPQLELLVMSGSIFDHCLSLLLSIPSHCPPTAFYRPASIKNPIKLRCASPWYSVVKLAAAAFREVAWYCQSRSAAAVSLWRHRAMQP